jgi:hypothetical protein
MAPPPQSQTPMYVTEVAAQDVLLGRGTGPNEHIGNCTFRDEVEKRKEAYSRADNRFLKEMLIRQTIALVNARRGRFLKKVAKKDIISRGLITEDVLYEVVTDISALAYKTRQAFRYSHRKNHDESAPVAFANAWRASISMNGSPSASLAKMPAVVSDTSTTSLSSRSIKASIDKSSSNETPPQPKSSAKAASSRMQPEPSVPDKKRKSSSLTTYGDSMSHAAGPKQPFMSTQPANAASIQHTAIATQQSQAPVVRTQQNGSLVQFSLLNHLMSNPDYQQSSLLDDAFARLRSLNEHPDVDRNHRLQDLGSTAADANRNFALSNFLRARTRRELELGGPEHGRGMDNERSRLKQELILPAATTITDKSRNLAEQADQGSNSRLQLETLRARTLESGLNPQHDHNRKLALDNNMTRSRIEQELATFNSNGYVNPLEALLRARLQLGLPITDDNRNIILDNSLGEVRSERDVSPHQADAGRSLGSDLDIGYIARQRVEHLFPVRQTPDVDSYRYLGMNHLLGNASNLSSLEQLIAACRRTPTQVTAQDSRSSIGSSDGMQNDSNPARKRQRG